MRTAVWWVLDHLCGWTGHNLFLCYYRPGLGLIRRLWHWSLA